MVWLRLCVLAQGAEHDRLKVRRVIVGFVEEMAGSAPAGMGADSAPGEKKQYVLRIQEEFLWHIMQKRKTVEARLADTAMERVFPGDIIRFGCTGVHGVHSDRHKYGHLY